MNPRLRAKIRTGEKLNNGRTRDHQDITRSLQRNTRPRKIREKRLADGDAVPRQGRANARQRALCHGFQHNHSRGCVDMNCSMHDPNGLLSSKKVTGVVECSGSENAKRGPREISVRMLAGSDWREKSVRIYRRERQAVTPFCLYQSLCPRVPALVLCPNLLLLAQSIRDPLNKYINCMNSSAWFCLKSSGQSNLWSCPETHEPQSRTWVLPHQVRPVFKTAVTATAGVQVVAAGRTRVLLSGRSADLAQCRHQQVVLNDERMTVGLAAGHQHRHLCGVVPSHGCQKRCTGGRRACCGKQAHAPNQRKPLCQYSWCTKILTPPETNPQLLRGGRQSPLSRLSRGWGAVEDDPRRA